MWLINAQLSWREKSCSPGRATLLPDFLYPIPWSVPLRCPIVRRHVTASREVPWQLEEFSVVALQQPPSINASLPPRSAWGDLGSELGSVLQGAASAGKGQNRCVCAIHGHRATAEALFPYVPKKRRSKWPFHSNTRLLVCPKLLPSWGTWGEALEWIMQYRIRPWIGRFRISTQQHSPVLFHHVFQFIALPPLVCVARPCAFFKLPRASISFLSQDDAVCENVNI